MITYTEHLIYKDPLHDAETKTVHIFQVIWLNYCKVVIYYIFTLEWEIY